VFRIKGPLLLGLKPNLSVNWGEKTVKRFIKRKSDLEMGGNHG